MEDESDMAESWKIDVLNQIKLFSPKKFESFSRLLFSHMGIKFDREKGVKMSGDHGIDGQRLVKLIEKYQLHITPVQTYMLDDYYFQED